MTETLQADTLQAKLTEVEAQFKDAREQKDYLRQKAAEAETLEQQLVGKHGLLQELLQELTVPAEPELEVLEAAETEVD